MITLHPESLIHGIKALDVLYIVCYVCYVFKFTKCTNKRET